MLENKRNVQMGQHGCQHVALDWNLETCLETKGNEMLSLCVSEVIGSNL